MEIGIIGGSYSYLIGSRPVFVQSSCNLTARGEKDNSRQYEYHL